MSGNHKSADVVRSGTKTWGVREPFFYADITLPGYKAANEAGGLMREVRKTKNYAPLERTAA